MADFFFWLWFDEYAKSHPWFGFCGAVVLALLTATGAYLSWALSLGPVLIGFCAVVAFIQLFAVRKYALRIVKPPRRKRRRA